MAPLLCEVCLGALQFRRNKIGDPEADKYNGWHGFGHHRTPTTLEQSAEQNCYICLVLWREILKIGKRAMHTWEENMARSPSYGVQAQRTTSVLNRGMFFTIVSFSSVEFSREQLEIKMRFCDDVDLTFAHTQYFTLNKLSCT
jgi:hypothetical protein